MKQNPQDALLAALPEDALMQLKRSFPEAGDLFESWGEWQGPIEQVVYDDENLSAAKIETTMRYGEEEIELHFAETDPPDLQSGQALEIRGLRLRNVVVAQDALRSSISLNGAQSCGPLGPQKAVVLLVTFPGTAAPTTTPQAVKNIISSTAGRSVDGYWREASYGQTSVTADVFGWYTLDAAYSCDQRNEMRAAAIRAADNDVDFRNYSRVFIVFPGSCSYSGFATIGCSTITSADGVVPASTAWLVSTYVNSAYGVRLFSHEGGHNLGLNHSSSRDFGAEALGPLNAFGTLSEYGDNFSTMGYWNYGHYTASQKDKLGWFPPSSVATVESTGGFSVQPLETVTAGTRALKIRRGTGNDSWLWVEYRQKTGLYDSTLPSQVFSGALVRYEDALTGSKTNLLDFSPATSSWNDPALLAGSTWVDRYSNLRLSVSSATPSALAVNVDYGPLPCTTSAPMVSLSPANVSALEGQTVSFTVFVTNRDSPGCAARAFSVSSALPSGWETALSEPTLTLAPSQSSAVAVTKTVPIGASLGTYTADVVVVAGTDSRTANASITVVTP